MNTSPLGIMPSQNPSEQPLILLAVTDSKSQATLRQLLTAEGYRVEDASNGLETLQKYGELHPSILLLSAELPELDGFQVCARLQESLEDSYSPVIMITDFNDLPAIDRAFAVGAAEIITTPIRWPILRHRIQRLIHSSETTRQLETERNLLRVLIDSLPEAVYVKDSEGRLLESNAAHLRELNLTLPTIIGKTTSQIHSPDVAALYQAMDHEVLEEGKTIIDVELPFNYQGSSQPGWSLNSKIPFRDRSGKIVGLIGISHNITKLKEAEQALKRSAETEHEQRILSDALREVAKALTGTLDFKDVMTGILDNVGRVLPHESATVMLIDGETSRRVAWRGYPPEMDAVLGSAYVETNRLANLRRMIASGAPDLIADTESDPNWVQLAEHPWIKSYIGAPIKARGQVIGFINLHSRTPGFFKGDDAERLQSYADLAAIAIQNAQLYEGLRARAVNLEERVESRTSELRQVKENFEAVFNYSSDGLAVLDIGGTLQRVNPALRAMLGIADLLPLNSLTEIAHPDYVVALNEAIRTVVESESPDRVEILARRADGSTFNADIALSPILGYERWLISCSIRDVTHNKLAEAALRASEEHFRTLIETAPTGILLADSTGRITLVNGAIESQFGYPRAELLNKSLDILLPERARPIFAQQWESYWTRPSLRMHTTEYESFGRRKDGTIFNTAVHISFISTQDGLQALSFVTDITERHRAEEAIRGSEQRYRQVVDHIDDMIFVRDLDGRILDVNPAACQALGYTRDELLERKVQDIEAPEFAALFAERTERLTAEGSTLNEGICVTKDGRYVDVSMSAIMMTYGGQPAVLSVRRDVTQRKRMEEALAHESDLLQALMDNLPDGIFFKDSRSRFTRINRAHAQYLGVEDPAEALGKTDFDFRMPRLSKASQLEEHELMASGIPVLDHIEWNPLSGGENRWYSSTKVPMRGKDGRIVGLVGISRDVTRYLQLETELRQALEQQQELNDLKSLFITTASHEFRTPLTTIASSAGLLEMASKRMTEEQQIKHLTKIQTAVTHIVQLLDDVLVLNETESDVLQFDPLPLDLMAFCSELIEELEMAPEYAGRLAFVPGDNARDILLDSKLTRQIVHNLLTNALKYSPAGGKARLELNWYSDHVEIRVVDEGIGIPEPDQKRIFETFYRGSNTHSISGTGLGLPIVKQAAERQGGSVNLSSKENIGTTVVVSLPG
ncbi:MAG TPA: PAS domain S-box protein [Aggregatilineales bacterium]|nr:PAS domain S-box protein [Aggregatilineales bacterium]